MKKNQRLSARLGLTALAGLALAVAVSALSPKDVAPSKESPAVDAASSALVAAPGNGSVQNPPQPAPHALLSILYDQMDNPGTDATVSQDFEAGQDNFDNQAADDFVVPTPEVWTVGQVVAKGVYFNGPGPAMTFNVTFYSDTAGFPGAAVPGGTYRGQAYTNANGNFTISLTPTPLVLTPGTYWVSVQARMDNAPGGEWGWNDRTVTSNSAAVWQNPLNGFGTGCATYGRRGASCGIDVAAPDQNFQILGGSDCDTINRIVNNNNDSGTDSLRAVIAAACTGQTITFAPNVRGAINLTSGELLIRKNLTINGPGANLLTVQRSAAAGNSRIFNITPNHIITLSGLTIANGQLSGSSFPGSAGGGILNEQSTLTLSKCVLSGNKTSLYGGALLNLRGAVTLTGCTLDQNSATASGGAILNAGYNGVATLTLTNCTLNQNQAGQYGGAIYNDGTSSGNASLTFTNCTLNQNTAALLASGIYNDALNPGSSGVAHLKLQNTILRAGASGANLVNDGGTIVSGGHNLSSDAAGGPAGTGPGGFLNATGDKRNTDPQLDPAGLANNGGPTMTIALQATSPAINGGDDNLSPPTDQRGYLRNGVSDIGSFEFGGTLPPTLIPVCVSRKLHGSFVGDIPLPRSGALGVECRTGGASGIHQVIMTFPGTVTVTDASVTTGVGGVSSFSVSGPEVTVNLTGVSNIQKIVIRLFGVSDGTNTNDVDVPMGVLLGDTNGNGLVNSTDVSLTKLKSGQVVDASNFRTDVTVSNSINSSDVSTVKSKSGTALP